MLIQCDSVSVAAENVVGVGAARTCTTQTISDLISYIQDDNSDQVYCLCTVQVVSI